MTPPASDLPAGQRLSTDGAGVRDALVAASTWLDAQAERVNALNVFPVPDGDTGTNMSLTLRAAADAVRALPDVSPAGDVARAAYQAALMSARGNSGVILSQLLSGFSQALEGRHELHAPDLARALAEASRVAYRGVSQPVEGTILTVARRAAEAAEAAAARGHDLTSVLGQAVDAAGLAVAETPNQLEVLRKAGVVDSGGEGYRVVLEGAWMYSTGRSIAEAAAAKASADVIYADLAALGVDEGTPFGFCTELLLQGCDLPVQAVKATMEGLGESVLAVGDADLLRVHVHTLRPGQALEFAVDHGTLARVKVENMQLQHQAFAAGAGPQATATAAPGAPGGPAAQESPRDSAIGVIAVAPGDGLREVFRSMGAIVVGGGQSMNPSVQEILAAVKGAGHEQVMVLPNNGNILLTAERVKEFASVPVEVIPTRTIPQGLAALLAFNFDDDLAGNVRAMADAAAAVHTVEVARAVRDADVDGIAVCTGQYMGILDERAVAVAASPEAAALEALGHVSLESAEIVTIYYGEEVAEAQAESLAGHVRDRYTGLSVEVVRGGQPHYPYLLGIE